MLRVPQKLSLRQSLIIPILEEQVEAQRGDILCLALHRWWEGGAQIWTPAPAVESMSIANKYTQPFNINENAELMVSFPCLKAFGGTKHWESHWILNLAESTSVSTLTQLSKLSFHYAPVCCSLLSENTRTLKVIVCLAFSTFDIILCGLSLHSHIQ